MNVLMLLTNKANTAYLYENDTLSQGISLLKSSGYTAIPVIDKNGIYVGCVSEGDFLWRVIENGIDAAEHICIKDIIRENFTQAVRIDVSLPDLLDKAIRQNFIPVTDDRGTYIGIVTRKDIILAFIKETKTNQ